jgi:hypothetical protein
VAREPNVSAQVFNNVKRELAVGVRDSTEQPYLLKFGMYKSERSLSFTDRPAVHVLKQYS